MFPKMNNTLRKIKRKLLTGGFAKPVYHFLKDIKHVHNDTFHPTDGSYLVNLSFDLELAFNSPLWRNEPHQTLRFGKRALENFEPTARYLNGENIEYNVQIVAGLLDKNAHNMSFLDSSQVNFIKNHSDLFHLSPTQAALLQKDNVEVGIHGLSHRHFTSLSRQEAAYEVENAVALFNQCFGKKPRFMSFPKNYVAHVDLLKKHGILSWRSDKQVVKAKGEVPVGLWFAPGVLGPEDLRKLLSILRGSRRGYMLHLWGHFTEMNIDVFKSLIGVIKESGWNFVNIKNFK